jgi:hypothetical protein
LKIEISPSFEAPQLRSLNFSNIPGSDSKIVP